MKKRPIWFLIIGIFILIVPTLIYLCILVPQLKEEYSVLLASGGVIGGSGYYGASRISDKIRYSSLYKLSCNAFTTLTLITLVEKFIMQLVFLVATFIVSFIIYKILKETYKKYRRLKENGELANQISQAIINNT